MATIAGRGKEFSRETDTLCIDLVRHRAHATVGVRAVAGDLRVNQSDEGG